MARRGKMGNRTPVPAQAARRPPKGKRAPAAKRGRGRKGNGAASGSRRADHIKAFDANHGMHLPLPIMTTPYVVQRFITNFAATPNATQNTYVLIFPGGFKHHSIGEVPSGNADSYTNAVGIYGLAAERVDQASVITSADLTQMASFSGNSHPEMAISAMSVDICCNSSAINSSGQVWMGRLNAPVEYWGFNPSNFANSFNGFLGRQGVLPVTYHKLYSTHKVLALPMDYVAYESFMPVMGYNGGGASGANSGQTCVNSLTPLLFVLSPGSSSYNIRIAIEARVRYPVSSPNYTLHARHAPTSTDTFNRILQEGEDIVGGVIDAGEAVGQAVSAARRYGLAR